jgi:hypothetical protein
MGGLGANAIVAENTDTPYVVAGIDDPGQREPAAASLWEAWR